jgi:HTH-type transcriptional regulator/antitoxin HigA
MNTNNSEKKYEKVMNQIELLLQKSTQLGGFEKLSDSEKELLKSLSLIAEKYEDDVPLIPIKTPNTIIEMIRYKMFEMNIKQKQLAQLLEMSEARISEVLSGKRKVNIELAKKLHIKLNIDADFILKTV